MARLQARKVGSDDWRDSNAIPELESLFDALDPDERTLVRIGSAEWRRKPVDPELFTQIREAIVLNDFTSDQVNGVVRVLEAHGLV